MPFVLHAIVRNYRQKCVCRERERERERDYAFCVNAFSSLCAFLLLLASGLLSCLYSIVPTSCDSVFHLFDIKLHYSFHVCCHVNVTVCVFVCLCICLAFSFVSWFVFSVYWQQRDDLSDKPVHHVGRQHSETILFEEKVCLQMGLCVYSMCHRSSICVCSVWLVKAIWFECSCLQQVLRVLVHWGVVWLWLALWWFVNQSQLQNFDSDYHFPGTFHSL